MPGCMKMVATEASSAIMSSEVNQPLRQESSEPVQRTRIEPFITWRNIILAIAAILTVASMVNFHNASQFAKIGAPNLSYALGWRGCQFLAAGILAGFISQIRPEGK